MRNETSQIVCKLYCSVIISPQKNKKFKNLSPGRSKSNLGWTPLHLATYFGHGHVVEVLLINGCDVNACNEAGDTALHKAAFIGREVRLKMGFLKTYKIIPVMLV